MINNDNLINLLQSTLNPSQKNEAEAQLKLISNNVGFSPMLLQVVVSESYKMPLRQAAAIYFKNYISKTWNIIDGKTLITEHDKTIIKDNIIEAIIHSPDLIRSQLSLSLSSMIKYDFPDKWSKLLFKIENFIKDENPDISLGGLVCFHQLAKIYEYKKAKERQPLYDALSQVLPVICQKFQSLLSENTEKSMLIQKTILKTFYCAIQYQFPPILTNHEFFSSWMHILLASLKNPIPSAINDLDEDERMNSVWWKSKKWILHIFCRICERYGIPTFVSKEYKDFAQYFMITYSASILEVVLSYLDFYRQGHYITPRVLHYSFAYLTESVSQSFTWKLLKPHIQVLVHDVIFKLLVFNEEDQNLWENDPIEYIRTKFDIYEDFGSPITAAQDFMYAVCIKRAGILQEIVTFTVNRVQLLQAEMTREPMSPDYSVKCRQIDALLNMLGTLAAPLISNLSKSKDDTPQNVDYSPLTYILTNFVCPLFSSSNGFLRARACWMITQFRKVPLGRENALPIMNTLKELLLKDPDLPVKFEASLALKSLVKNNDIVKEALTPSLKEIISELLNILKQTLNEEMTLVLKKLLCVYSDQIKPLILEMLTHIHSILESTEHKKDDEEVRIFVSGLLEIVETLVDLLEENKDAIMTISDSVLQIINLIVTKYQLEDSVEDFYDEVISIANSLTAHVITPNDWNLLPLLYNIYLKDKESFFVEMIPVFYNFITNDKTAFQSDPSRFQIIFTMCKDVLNERFPEEEMEMHALKILEVILFDYPDTQEQLIPLILEIVFKRLFETMHVNEAKAFEAANRLTNGTSPASQPISDIMVSGDTEDDEDKFVMTPNCEAMNIQLILACLFVKPTITLGNLAKMQGECFTKYNLQAGLIDPNPPSYFLSELVKRAIAFSELLPGIHDNKILVLGLSTLLNLSNENRRQIKYFTENQKLISDILYVLEVIKRHKRARAQSESSWEDDDDMLPSSGDELEYVEPTKDDEDCADESRKKYLEAVAPSSDTLESLDDKKGSGGDIITEGTSSESIMHEDEGTIDDEDLDEDDDEYGLESYTCSIDDKSNPIDEFIVFQDTIKNIQINDPEFYSFLTAKMTKNEQARLKNVYQMADIKKKTLQ